MADAAGHTEADRGALAAHLDVARRHVLGALDGLSDSDLRHPHLPSGWSALGLVQHLTWDVERFWFRCVLAGDQDAITALDGIDDAWQVTTDVPAEAVLAAYREAVTDSEAILARTPLDAPPAWWPEDLFGSFRLGDARAVALHVMVETATHAGHLDAARELADGSQWLVLRG